MEPSVSFGQVFRFGLFEVEVARKMLTRNGVRVKIQDQPFRVLVLLLERPGEIVTREELRQKLWPEDTHVDFDGGLNVTLRKLRSAIDDDADNPRFVETVPRRGYRFIAPVLANSAKSEPVSPGNIPPQSSAVVKGAPTAVPPPEKEHPMHLIYAASALAVLILIVATWFTRHWSQNSAKTQNPPSQTAATVALRKSVAVLGFQNISGRVDDAWLATAFSEMLSTELAGGEKLRLVSGEEVENLRLLSPWSRTDSLKKETTARIGTALNSDLLVLGSYTTVGRPNRGQLRLDARLQDAKTGEVLTEIAEIGSTQDLFHIVSHIGGKLRDRLGVPSLAETDEPSMFASLPSNSEAARFYTLGLDKLRDYDASAAKDLLQQAIRADPKFPLTHSNLARAWSQLGYEQKRKEEAKRALDLSSNLPRVNRMLVEGDYYESLARHEKAASTYQALFALLPDSVEFGLQLALAQNAAGQRSQAMGTIAQLRRLPPPASGDPRIDLAQERAMPDDKAAALVLVRNALAKAAAQDKKLVYAQARLLECMILIYGGQPEKGEVSCQDASTIFLAAGNRLGAADALRLIGDRQGAQGHYDQAISTYQRVLVVLQELGEHEKTGAVLNNMAINFANEGQLDRADQLYRKAKYHFDQAGDKANAGVALSNIADILYLRGKLPEGAKLYQQAIESLALLDPGAPGYAMCRLADLELAQGQTKKARDLAAQAVGAIRPTHSQYQSLTEAMAVLGGALMAQADLRGARQQYEQTLETRQKMGEQDLVEESHVSLARLSLEENHPDQAEPLLRAAIAEFEKEKGEPDATGAYTLLSRALLMQGKLEEAHKAIQHAAELARNVPDPALALPITIQSARIETSAAGQAPARHLGLATARQQLRSAIATARKLGYYQIECEARLALGEAELQVNPALGRSQLDTLEKETHEHGLELLSRKARQLASANQSLYPHQ
jgi:DNA-binding winged helix-turn-helix (wHTH) protein/tetratricopeptide (TPR) repeat protein/TolB-like protein